VIENFIGTKSRRKFLEGLKRKVGIFIGTKNIFNPKKYTVKTHIYIIFLKKRYYIIFIIILNV